MTIRISELTQVKTLDPVHSLGRFGRRTVLGEFVVTKEGAEIIESVLESITGNRLPETEKRKQAALSLQQIRRSHLVRANFGTGKTITLLALSEMLAALGDPERFELWREQFHRFPTVQTQYSLLREQAGGRPFICLLLDMKEKGAVPFRDVVVQALHGWLEKNAPDVSVNSEFVSIAEQLDSAATRMPEQVQKALELYAPNLSIEELYQSLLDWDRSMLNLAYKVLEEAAGFPPTRNQLEMRSYYEEVRTALTGQYGGIAVVLDELHHFFTTASSFNTLSVSLADFDAFAVFTNETKNEETMPCTLVGAIHENLGSYLRSNGASQDAFQQAVGRFNEHPLTSSVSQAELISGAFVRNNGALQELLRRDPLLGYQAREIQNRSESATDWLPCFPLHPSVVTYLPLLSRRLAQNDRTTFHFIGEKVRHWVNEREAVWDGHLNLIMLPEVFAYFSKAVEERDPATIRAVNNAVSYCEGGELHRRVAETLACLHVASSISTTEGSFRVRNGATRKSLDSYLNFPEEKLMDKVLKELTASGYIHISDWQEYILVANGGLSHVELNRRVDQKAASIDADQYLLTRMKSDWMLRNKGIFPATHISKGSVSRSFETRLVSVEDLKAFDESPGTGHSGTFLFVVPPLTWNYDMLRKEVEGELSRLYEKAAIVGLPLRWDEIRAEAIQRQEALRQLKNEAATEEQKRTIDGQLLPAESQLNQRLSEFVQPGNWLFYSAYGLLKSNKKTLAEVLTPIVESRYAKFPEFKAPNLQSASLIHSLLDRFLPNPVHLRCDSTTKSRVDSIMASVGLASSPPEDPALYSLRAPSDEKRHPNSLAVWRELESMDLAGENPLEQLYNRLLAPPYGLLPHMVELYLGTYIRVRGLAVYHRKTVEYIQDLQTSTLKDITAKKDGYYRLDPPAESDSETLQHLAALWVPLAQAAGNQNYLVASDVKAPDASKAKLLAQDVKVFCDLVTNRLLTPLRQLGRPDETGENLIEALAAAVSQLDRPPSEILKLILEIVNPESVERLRRQAAAAGTKLMVLAERRQAFLKMSAPNPERYPDLAAAHANALSSLNSLDLENTESAGAALQSLDSFQPLFLAHYGAEHDELQAARKLFGEKVQGSPLFSLLKALGQINPPAKAPHFVRTTNIEAKVLAERKRVCSVQGSEAHLNSNGYICGQCPDGGYRLGTSTELVRDLQTQETHLLEDLAQAIRDYHDWLNQLDSPNHAVAELGLPTILTQYLFEHEKNALGPLQLVKLSLPMALESGDGKEAAEHLKQLLPGLNRYLSQASSEETGPKRVRMTLQEVVHRAEKLLTAEGLDVISLEPSVAAERRKSILAAVEKALTNTDAGSILEIVLRRSKDVG